LLGHHVVRSLGLHPPAGARLADRLLVHEVLPAMAVARVHYGLLLCKAGHATF